ncbi:MFS transporter [Pectinatus haikarae]|uniref:ACS family glucarate transporter-like MFS transporter n=1 Tax=Pectinatus haikarae TaxID=349096 RepID=A0ABT9YAX3_9FIRM|nr:MFS transporter [Pectinatus haikarae]MDQ0204979.1 ACS family glucarate transporter-like MFS transporter [Pectinatus haikarae]
MNNNQVMAECSASTDDSKICKRTKVRWIVAGLMWAAIAINFLDRTTLAIATPHIMQDLHVTTEEMGILMSAFFLCYALLQIPAGFVSDKLGQRKVLGLSVLWWSIATGLTGIATGFKSLMGLRMILGVGEAGAYPSNAAITRKWFPKSERATVGGLFDSGQKFGGAFGVPILTWMMLSVGWRETFAVLGGLGIAWAIAWWLFFKDDPAEHKGVNKLELEYIRDGEMDEKDKTMPLKWWQLLRYRNVIAMCIGFFMINYNSYFFITWLPMYLMKDRGLSFSQMGFAASLPLLFGAIVEILAGYLSDRVHSSGRMSLTKTRKLFLCIGLVMAAFIGFAAVSESLAVALVLLCISKSGTVVAASQVWAIPSEIAPRNMTGVVAGIQNCVSNFGGVVGPVVTGFIVGYTGHFEFALLFSAFLLLIAIFNFIFVLGKIEPIKIDK